MRELLESFLKIKVYNVAGYLLIPVPTAIIDELQQINLEETLIREYVNFFWKTGRFFEDWTSGWIV